MYHDVIGDLAVTFVAAAFLAWAACESVRDHSGDRAFFVCVAAGGAGDAKQAFLDKNSFYLSSAGFRVQLANDAAGKQALHALPPHRFVMHRYGNDVRYLCAEPNHCVCIFIGTQGAYQSFRDMLAKPLDQPDYIAPDYKTQASALLYGDPYDWNNLNQPASIADYLRTYY